MLRPRHPDEIALTPHRGRRTPYLRYPWRRIRRAGRRTLAQLRRACR